jgi:uncharacterized membrane protein YoaK (UPF0700 family)
VGQYTANLFAQPFFATLLSGMIGALAVRYNLSSSLRLLAVSPCMILVPGPHMLNGALDFIRGRVSLGTARLTYAGLVVVAISIGLLLGLSLLGVSLPPGRAVPLMIAVCAMASQYALFRLAAPRAVSTAAMTGNLTNTVLALMDMLSRKEPLTDGAPERLRPSVSLLLDFFWAVC